MVWGYFILLIDFKEKEKTHNTQTYRAIIDQNTQWVEVLIG